jgi:hypothetical protein
MCELLHTWPATGASQINITNHAAVVPLPTAAAICNFLSQIWQPHIGAETLNQILFSILARQPLALLMEPFR